MRFVLVELKALLDLHSLRKSQWLKGESLKRLQEKKLRAIVDHAYNDVEFYRGRFDSVGIKPSDIRHLEDLSKIPLTLRSDVLGNYPDRMVARGTNLDECVKRKTSGSTGTPVEVVFDKRDQAFRMGVFYRALIECGLRITDKLTTMSYNDEKSVKWFQVFGLLRRQNIQTLTPLDQVVERLRVYQPDVFYSYASYLANVAQVVKEKGIAEIRPRLVFSHAEMLEEGTRALVRSVFGGEAFETYGSSEFVRLGWECPEHVGYHMDADGFVIEFLEDGEHVSPGERGEIFVTSLDSYAMPLLRYRIGDYGVPSEDECPCGRGLPLMKHIEGRADDFIRLPDGRLVSPRRVSTVVWNAMHGDQYRIIQKKLDLVIVELRNKDLPDKTDLRVSEGLREVLGTDVQVQIRFVDQIPSDKSGKIRRVTSEIPKR